MVEIIDRAWLPQSLSTPPMIEAVAQRDEQIRERIHELANDVVVTIAPRTVTGRRLQDDRGLMAEHDVHEYDPDRTSVEEALRGLEHAGFRIHRRGRFTITVSAPAGLISERLGIRLALQRRPHASSLRSTARFATSGMPPAPADLFVAPADSLAVRAAEESIDHYIFVPPPLHYQVSPLPPAPTYSHLTADEIRQLLNVPAGASAEGIAVAIVDTGFAPHPHYAAGGVRFRQVPGGPAAGHDPIGHGTALPMNVFAVAPDAVPLVVGYSTAVQDAIEVAVEDEHARIVSCSWGWDYEQLFPVIEASIRSVVEDDGVVFLVASGNGQYSWPSTMREVISIGGVYADKTNGYALEASNYASGFVSSLYPGRSVPDVCGLCGQAPRGIYIPMPCPPGSQVDVDLAGNAFPDGDETGANDGWVVTSGTSAATPQIAGIVALILGRAARKGRALTPSNVRSILQDTARPVTAGRNAFGFSATSGHPNVACGYGLVDAEKALLKV